MFFNFGKASLMRFHTLEEKLQRVAEKTLALGILDFSIVCGHRTKEEQDRALAEGKSKVSWPKGKHNFYPSKAMDLCPFVNGKLSWNKLHCCVLAGLVLAVAKMEGVKLRWGGNWNSDGEPITDQAFQDLVHFELVED